MRIKLSAVGQDIVRNAQRLGPIVVSQHPRDGDTAARSRYMESKRKMRQYCTAMAPCSPWGTCEARATVQVSELVIHPPLPPYVMCHVTPGTYRVSYWTGWSQLVNADNHTAFALNWYSIERHLGIRVSPSWPDEGIPLDASETIFATAQDLIDTYHKKANKPYCQISTLEPTAPLTIWCESDGLFPPSGELTIVLCKQSNPTPP